MIEAAGTWYDQKNGEPGSWRLQDWGSQAGAWEPEKHQEAPCSGK
jgi:hypothetical protein